MKTPIDGMKTYLAMLVGVGFAVAAAVAGELSWIQAGTAAAGFLGMGALRHGMKSTT